MNRQLTIQSITKTLYSK